MREESALDIEVLAVPDDEVLLPAEDFPFPDILQRFYWKCYGV
jgi:hypothetical protein